MATKCASGKVKTDAPLKDYKGNKCVYSRVEVSFYHGTVESWKRAHSSEQRTNFYVGKTAISVHSIDIWIEPTKVISGYIKRDKSMVEQFIDYAGNANALRIAKTVASYVPFIPKPNSPIPQETITIDDETINALRKDPTIERLIKQNIQKPIEVKEYTISPGDTVFFAANAQDASTIHPFLLTNTDEQTTNALIREKSLLTISIGAGLLLLSIASLFFVLS
jgi:hypothetical protein